MLVRPLTTNFKMTVRLSELFLPVTPFTLSGKALAPDHVEMGELALGRMFPSPPDTASEKKQTFHHPGLFMGFWAVSSQTQFLVTLLVRHDRMTEHTHMPQLLRAIWWAVSWTIVLSKVLKQNLTPNFWVLFSSFRGQGGQLRILLYTLCVFSRCSCVWLCNPMDCSPSGSSVNGISRQEYWSRLPFPSPGDLPHPGIKPASPALQADSLPVSHRRDPLYMLLTSNCFYLEMHIGRIVFAQVKPKGLLNSY